MREILTAGRYWKRKYGCRVYKIPVSVSGFTCPNIDGTVARGGCIYCENESFSPNLLKAPKRFYLNPKSEENPYIDVQLLQLRSQFDKTKNILLQKYGAKKFFVYFQSFTNTYAPLSTLKRLYLEALSFEDVAGLSIGTRTDSINEETLQFLKELNAKKEIWVEYGVQSVFDTTLERINRGHDAKNMFEWIKKTKEYG